MDLLSSYEALTASSNRIEVANVLRSITNGSFFISNTNRDRLVVLLLQDIESGVDRSDKKGRLTRKDVGQALLALKMLGRAAPASEIISKEPNLRILLNTAKALRSSDADAADDALRCVANALLLIERGRDVWVDIHGGAHCVDLLDKATSTTCIFLCSRILFLSTASSSSGLFQYLFGRPSISLSARIMEKGNHHDIVFIVSRQLDSLLNGILLGTAMSKEAMTDLLKFTFNLLCHWPKIAPDAEEVKLKNGSDETSIAGSSANDKPVLGERWTRRLDGLLPALRRLFLGLPPMSPSPLAAPVTHVLHSLLPIPIDDKLYPVWFPEATESSGSGRSTPKSTNSSPTTGEAHPRSSSSSDSPTGSSNGKGKEKEGAFDRALSMLTPRLSLSLSRSPSPVSPVARDTDPTIPPIPKVIQRCIDLLDVSLSHYLPGSIDPDDASVKRICTDEDVQLDHVLSPLVLLMVKLCKYNVDCRKAVRQKMLPPDLDRTTPLEGRPDTLGRCIRLMACVNHQQLKNAVGDLIYVLCDSDGLIMSSQIGYGNAAGFLFNRGILSAPPPVPSTASSGSGIEEVTDPNINPITGMVQRPPPSEPDMTDEEKEREAEKLFVLFERLEKAGGMENPIKKALHEGRLEKYAGRKRNEDEDEDDD